MPLPGFQIILRGFYRGKSEFYIYDIFIKGKQMHFLSESSTDEVANSTPNTSLIYDWDDAVCFTGEKK